MKAKYFFFSLLLIVAVALALDFVRISGYEVVPRRPSEPIKLEHNELYYQLVNGEGDPDWRQLDNTLEYIRAEYDCSDFRLVNLTRIIYEFGDRIPEPYQTKIEKTLLDFRYWWDEPGENSMCYWSENHQILFASAEYLIGKKYPDAVFPNSQLTGRQHMEKARVRILDWLEMRWKYGFTEFNSGTYYKEDIGALINIIDFADDDELVIKSQMAMDLLLYDVAVQNIKCMFASASGRAYERDRKGGERATLGGITDYFWGDGKELGPGIMYGMAATKKYTLPPALAEIARDSATVVIKQGNGLDIIDLKPEGYYGTDNRSMMMQWGMECFSNPEIIRNSLAHVRNCNMFSNDFIKDFKMLDFTLLDWMHLEPTLSRLLNPQSMGVAIQKGNTYTFKTKDFSMYTAQGYHPGTYGDQQHIFGVNIGNHFSIFHTHPAVEKDVNSPSPNYWVGYGHFPHTVQDENINLSIYDLPPEKGIMEKDLLDYTHAYFPMAKFDTAYLDGRYAFGKKGDTYCAFIGATNFAFKDNARDDIIQHGKQSYWITEAGSLERDGSFEGFVQRIKGNPVSFEKEGLTLKYGSNGNEYTLVFGEGMERNGQPIGTDYDRYDSPYIQAAQKDSTLTFRHNGKSLHLDFYNLKREF